MADAKLYRNDATRMVRTTEFRVHPRFLAACEERWRAYIEEIDRGDPFGDPRLEPQSDDQQIHDVALVKMTGSAEPAIVHVIASKTVSEGHSFQVLVEGFGSVLPGKRAGFLLPDGPSESVREMPERSLESGIFRRGGGTVTREDGFLILEGPLTPTPGPWQVTTAPGDSGGPIFDLDGRIVAFVKGGQVLQGQGPSGEDWHRVRLVPVGLVADFFTRIGIPVIAKE